ncbi:MAG: ABC transporter permease [Terracidiphilus sp.]|jgi:ABC-2 type transport system permease protein
MRNILLIARREYLEQIRGRAFIFSTVLVPLLIVALLGWSSMTARSAASSGKHIAIASDSASLGNAIRRQMLDDKNAKYIVDVVAPASEQARATLRKQIQSKAIDGLLTINTSSTGENSATYTSLSTGSYDYNLDRLRSALNRAAISERLLARGINQADADAALKPISVETLQLDKDNKTGKTKGAAPFYKSLLMALLLSMPIMLYGLDLARAIIEEKTSRIFEVMLSVARADDLLAGKMVGVGAVGLTQILIWTIAATLFMGSAMAATALTGNFAIHFSWMEGLLFPVYFVLGFALFSAMFSGLAATCETSQDLQKFMPLAIIPLYLSLGLLPVLLKDPNSVWAVAATLCPFTAPYLVLPRMGLAEVPLWQLGTSIALLILTIWATLWLSARLYRVGILMYGKRATLPELVRWLRYS